MKSSFLLLTALVGVVVATPTPRAACTSPVKLSGNPFQGRTLHANSRYAGEVNNAVAQITDSTLKAKAQKVASVGTFLWLDTIASISTFEKYLTETQCNEIFGVVIYDLPGRDCAAKASNGELAAGDVSTYQTKYIDPIVAIIKKHPEVAIAAIIEPDSLPNLVTNSGLATCQASASGYRQGVQYALKNLNLPNVAMYLDAGHGGWLGWDANLQPGAQELANAYKGAGSPASLRGFSTNVAGWNAWSKVPGEFENTSDGQYNKAQDENRYVNLFGAALASAGMPNHAIVDTGRNAVQGLRDAWGDWCNVDGAGFGVRPTTNTGNSLADAFVWVKPGGESDGTSDSSAQRYDSFCGLADAFKPSPEAGTWNEAFFEMLLKNAVPSF
ncbi:1,4-beta-D-glucan cellobiohydrolase cel6c [Marasmius oreades]|nr:1,4-beta-D-glucan cellobiohydrolase cel6c [Marasmius oreades]KAG7092888.1 1,4-beta-D-glucan cellobiohydrolase cel6c [Marasmius oreades]